MPLNYASWEQVSGWRFLLLIDCQWRWAGALCGLFTIRPRTIRQLYWYRR